MTTITLLQLIVSKTIEKNIRTVFPVKDTLVPREARCLPGWPRPSQYNRQIIGENFLPYFREKPEYY
jgi:hypothetical protein